MRPVLRQKNCLRPGSPVGVAFLLFISLFPSNHPASRPGEEKPRAESPLEFRTVDMTLRPRESLHALLRRFGLDAPTSHALIESVRPFLNPREMRAGQNLHLIVDSTQNEVKGLKLPFPRAVVESEWSPSGWSAGRREIPAVREMRAIKGTLLGNLYQDGRTAGLTPAQIMEMADIFQYDIDFFSDFRRGDTFSVLFDELRYANGRVEPDRILAAELTVAGNPVSAFYHRNGRGEGGYYNRDGQSLRNAFLRAPLNYRRISSGYSLKRQHPILRTVRPHLAIDYAAPAATPVVSIGKGTVSFAGWSSGYGNLVEVVHPNSYTTRYGHFSRITAKIRKGTQVAQGQVIGYVGQTGHATGPHLHFEMLRGGKKINFLSLRIPRQERLTGDELVRFAATRDDRLALLRNDPQQLASR